MLRSFRIAVVLILLCGAVEAAEVVRLTSDEMDYDPGTKEITASGSVVLTRGRSVISGDYGRGDSMGERFEILGSVVGSIVLEEGAHPIALTCDSIVMSTSGDVRTVALYGGARLTRGGDAVTADTIAWREGEPYYHASGSVDGHIGSHELRAKSATRDGDAFWAEDVERYRDRGRDLIISAERLDGAIAGDAVVEVTAVGGVRVEGAAMDGVRVVITGDRGVYSIDRGTFVVSGGARIIQQGRSLEAGSVVYWLDDGRIEAVSRPSLTIHLDG